MIEYKVSTRLPSLKGLAKHASEELRKAVARTALKIESDAKLLAPVDTGALRASILPYGGALRSAQPRPDALRLGAIREAAKLGKKSRRRVPFVPGPPAPGSHEARVSVHVEYGYWQEKKRRYMAGAIRKNRGLLKEQVAAALKRSERKGDA